MRAALKDEIKPAQIYTCMTRAKVVFLWPVRLPGENGKNNQWWQSAHEIAQEAQRQWVRCIANQRSWRLRTDREPHFDRRAGMAGQVVARPLRDGVRKPAHFRSRPYRREAASGPHLMAFAHIWALDFEFRAPPGEFPSRSACVRRMR